MPAPTSLRELVSPPEDRIPAAVRGLSLVSLFNDFASEMVYPLLPAFVTRVLGGGAVALGALDGAAELTAAALKWVSGRLADRPGWRRPLILLGYLSAVLVRPLIAVASSAWQVVGFRVIDRVGKGLRTPPRDALIAELTPLPIRGRAYGFHRAADHAGAVLGSLAAWYALHIGADVRRVIGWSVVPGLVAVAVLVPVLWRVGAGHARPMQERADDAAAPVRVPLPVVALAALTLARLPEALMLLRLQDLGVPVPAIPLLWAALHVVRSAASYPGGWLVDRLGGRGAVAAGGVLFAAVMAALGARLGPSAAMAVFLGFGMVAGLTESAERTLVAALSPARLGRGFGAYHALTGLAALPAGIVFGALYDRMGGGVALQLSAATVLVAVVAWLIVTSRGPVAGSMNGLSP